MEKKLKILNQIQTSWKDHIKFAQWIVKRKNPEVIVDLGVDFGYSTFCLTKNQRDHIIKKGIKRRGDFVSSFESVCTLTPMEFFDIYKTDWKFRTFLEVEQHYTNYC